MLLLLNVWFLSVIIGNQMVWTYSYIRAASLLYFPCRGINLPGSGWEGKYCQIPSLLMLIARSRFKGDVEVISLFMCSFPQIARMKLTQDYNVGWNESKSLKKNIYIYGVGEFGFRVSMLVLFLFYGNVSEMCPRSHLSSQPLTIPAPWVFLRAGWSISLVKWFHLGWLPLVFLRRIGRLS